VLVHRAVVVLFAALAAMTTACGAAVISPGRPAGTSPSVDKTTTPATVTADPVRPDPRIGAIFLGGYSMHTCTASVVHSTNGDLIITAAHCMADGVETYFAPGFAETVDPRDMWHIDAVYLDPRWVANQDPLADFAIARVSSAGGGAVEASVGGGFDVGSTPRVGTDVAVTGYALGDGGVPVGCTTRVAGLERGYPTVKCAGLVDGTSGGPWLAGSTVVGLTGGLEGGGCEANVSYTSPFDGAITQLLTRAEAGGPADTAPPAFEDDC
jgi:Trypsin-like peptidase domain